MRILSIDYGKKRTGLAVTDPLQIIAGGLATVATAELFTYLESYIQKEQVERIVIGKPTQPNGQPSENLARVENFFNRWRKAGHWARILQAVSAAYDGDIQMIDASSIRVHQHAANGQKKTSDPVAWVVRAAA